MSGKIILYIIIYSFVAFFMICIGIYQLKSKEPVTFYTGEKPLKKEEIKDVEMWNKKHGMGWIIYGVVIMISCIISIICSNSFLSFISLVLGVIVPIIFMILYHHKLIKKYKK